MNVDISLLQAELKNLVIFEVVISIITNYVLLFNTPVYLGFLSSDNGNSY